MVKARTIGKFLGWGVAVLALLSTSLFTLQYLASERVEVVELSTVDEDGETVLTRLWVVDDDGFQYLRVGADGSGWFTRLQVNEEFTLRRGSEQRRYTAVLRADKRERINTLMQGKYTWGDSLIAALVGGRDGSIPVELHPAGVAAGT